MARSGSPKFQCRQFVCPPRTWTPARRCALTFDARIDTGFREMNPLTQCVVVSFSGLDTFTCVAADRLLCQGLARFVASSCAWFSSELLVRLCSCRISRLVYISFAWRTSSRHNMVFSFRFLLYSLLLRPFGLRSVTIFKPYEKTSMPLTEPDLQISSIRLFSLTHLAPDNVKLCTILGLGNG